MGEWFEIENGRYKVTDKFRETIAKAAVVNLDELECMRTSSFKIACKKSWEFTKNFIRKGIEFEVRVIKALKYSITH